MTTQNENEIYFHDIDEELDDQTAIKKRIDYLEQHPEESRTVYLVATNGVYKAKLNSEQRNEIFYEYFPEYTGLKTFKEGNSQFHILTVDEANELSGMTFRMLQIAPLTGVKSEFFENNTIISRVLMGECLPTPSINTNKSWCNNMDEGGAQVLDKEFHEQNEYLEKIPTRYISQLRLSFVRKVPFSFDTLNSLPDYFKSKLFDKVFNMFVGRVPPHLGFCENVTCGANLPTALGYMRTFKITNLDSDKDNEIKEQVDEFMKLMTSCNDKEKMLKSLFDINRIVYLVTGNVYGKKDGKYGFSPDSLENYEESFKNFMDLAEKYKLPLTPAYDDVLAMYHFMENTEFDIDTDYIIPI
jgi:hypothetical protein